MCFQCWLKLRIGDSATSSGCHLSVKSEAPDWLYRATFLQATAWAGAPSQLLMEQTRENLCWASPNTYVVAKSSHLLIHLGNPLPYTRLLQWTQFLKTSCRVFSIDVPRLPLACGRLLFFYLFYGDHQNICLGQWEWESWFLFWERRWVPGLCPNQSVRKRWTRCVSTSALLWRDNSILSRLPSCRITGRTCRKK